MAQTAGTPRSYHNILLYIIIWALGVVDKITRGLYHARIRLVAGPGKVKPGGSNPAPPKTMGIIITEPNIADVSLRTVANIAAWCMSHGVQQVHLYDPSGHFKRSQAVLADNLHTAALQEGSTVTVKCGWSAAGAAAVAAPLARQLQLPSALEAPVAQAAAAAAGGAYALSSCIIDQQQSTSSQHLTQEDIIGLVDSGHKSSQHLNRLDHQQQSHSAFNGQQHQQTMQSCDVEEFFDCGDISMPKRCKVQRPASVCINSSSSSSSHGSQGSVASVRLLSAEDGYDPVIAAAVERCAAHIISGSSPKAISMCKQARGRLHLLEGSSGSSACCRCCSSADISSSSSSKRLCVCSSRPSFSHCCGSPAAATVERHAAVVPLQQPCRSWSSSSSSRDGPVLAPCCSHKGSTDGPSFLVAAPECSVAAEDEHQTQPCVQQNCNLRASCGCGQQGGALKEKACGQVSQLLDGSDPDHHMYQQQQQQQQQKKSLTKLAVPPQSLSTHNLQQQKQDGSILPELAAVIDADILSEPQLLLVFGPVLSLAGYPPFHTRACEVQYMGNLVSASRQKVANAIAGYCKVLQRHGS